MLGYPDPNRPYVLYTDASNDCIGACFTQPCDDQGGSDPNFRNEKCNIIEIIGLGMSRNGIFLPRLLKYRPHIAGN